MKFHVSLNGDDKNSGSVDAPFRTLAGARSAAALINEDVEIELAG